MWWNRMSSAAKDRAFAKFMADTGMYNLFTIDIVVVWCCSRVTKQYTQPLEPARIIVDLLSFCRFLNIHIRIISLHLSFQAHFAALSSLPACDHAPNLERVCDQATYDTFFSAFVASAKVRFINALHNNINNNFFACRRNGSEDNCDVNRQAVDCCWQSTHRTEEVPETATEGWAD